MLTLIEHCHVAVSGWMFSLLFVYLLLPALHTESESVERGETHLDFAFVVVDPTFAALY